MVKTKEALLRMALHILELVATVGGSWVLLALFDLDTQSRVIVLGLVVNALSKFARTHENIPVPDFVNE